MPTVQACGDRAGKVGHRHRGCRSFYEVDAETPFRLSRRQSVHQRPVLRLALALSRGQRRPIVRCPGVRLECLQVSCPSILPCESTVATSTWSSLLRQAVQSLVLASMGWCDALGAPAPSPAWGSGVVGGQVPICGPRASLPAWVGQWCGGRSFYGRGPPRMPPIATREGSDSVPTRSRPFHAMTMGRRGRRRSQDDVPPLPVNPLIGGQVPICGPRAPSPAWGHPDCNCGSAGETGKDARGRNRVGRSTVVWVLLPVVSGCYATTSDLPP